MILLLQALVIITTEAQCGHGEGAYEPSVVVTGPNPAKIITLIASAGAATMIARLLRLGLWFRHRDSGCQAGGTITVMTQHLRRHFRRQGF